MKKLFYIFIIYFFLFSCTSIPEIKKDSDIIIQTEELPRTVAILPFENKTDEKGIANQIRRSFYNHFSSKPYKDIELGIVDEKIVQLEKSKGKSILEIPANEICDALGCDGLIYGRVTEFTKIYAVAYSQLGVEAEVWMVNTKTGKEAMRIKDAVRYHEGGVPLSPLSAVMTAVTIAINLRDIQHVRVINELCYKLNEKIPSPHGLAGEERPIIREVLTNAKETPFGKGKIIRVGLEGDKDLVATFDIGNFKKGILMNQIKPGIYTGDYVVLPGDNIKEAPIVVSLKKPGGYETQWIDLSGFITIDTTPPPPVENLRAKGFHDRIEISWNDLRGIPDLRGYKVLRSEQPLTGFQEIAKVEKNFFEDRNIQFGKTYYYRVTAFDEAANTSDPQDAVSASLISKEPVALSGELQKDEIISGVYLVKGILKIPRGITLKIEPGTRILFEEKSKITIEGRIELDSKGDYVEFIPTEGKRWLGMEVINGNVNLKGFKIRGAETCLTIFSSSGTIKDGIVSECQKGVYVTGIPSPVFSKLTVSGSDVAIEFTKTDAKMDSSNIFQNKKGIILNESSGELKDNNIFDNEINITSQKITKIDANYLGSLNTEEMRIENIEITKVYDRKLPDGKIVDPIINPYIKLTQEERQKKATELLVEAGGFFRQRNYGKAVAIFEEALKAHPSADIYYYIAICYQEMKEEDKVKKYLLEGTQKFPGDQTLKKSLGLIYYQAGKEEDAKKIFEDVLRLNPEDRQIKFIMERMGK